jgi:DNA polymerase/3'-5' exonuclease PolX
MGVCHFNSKNRRIDLKYYSIREIGFALVHFTGSDGFNRYLRNIALRKGLLMNDKGFYEKGSNKRIEILANKEEIIFDYLG